MPGALQGPAVTSQPVNCDHMAPHVEPAAESVTSWNFVRETHRTAQLIIIAETAACAIMATTTVSRGNVRHTTLNASSTSVSRTLIGGNVVYLARHAYLPDNIIVWLHTYNVRVHVPMQIPIRVTTDVTPTGILGGISLVTVATLRQPSLLALRGESTMPHNCNRYLSEYLHT